ncbi:DUF2285 domain-containing protein [Sphingomonas sp. AP4-R1]|uniref:DNA -binding domain-containing protein n=1 Tax=Sphingomonas sp. AP4-R1 TaxID=2735134 RepID=UPI0014935C30|nr:DUF2285 domain-containing protein [Sphingomonas sp. AP4-R1]QJU60077.1 DUF2285 domain-containing protein [Sphingomonas sp. AP4-R1]
MPRIAPSIASVGTAGSARLSSASPRTRAPVQEVSSFAEDPALPADRAQLFWARTLDPLVVPSIAVPAPPGDPASLDLFALPIPAVVLTRQGCAEELLLGPNNRSVRLSVVQGSLLTGPVRLQFLLTNIPQFAQHLLALRRLTDLLQTGSPCSGSIPDRPALARRLLLIQTLDALAVDARHRSVAIALFGQARVEHGWNAGTDHLRSRVRRLIRQALALVQGGYLDLFAMPAD